MNIKPDGRIDLEHRASFFLRGTPNNAVILASDTRLVSIIRPDRQSVETLRLPSKMTAISPHPQHEFLGWIDGASGRIRLQKFDGSAVVEFPEPTEINKHFEDCHFDDSGVFLWLVGNQGRDCEVLLCEIRTGRLVDKIIIADPFGGSSCSFHTCRRPNVVSLWLAAGQDGQQVYWLECTGNKITATLEKELVNTTPPDFSPSGKQFLVNKEFGELCKFEFPSVRVSGSQLVNAEHEDDPFSTSICFLNENCALAGTNEQRIFAVDLVQMKIEGEVEIEGHEPRPIGAYYPSLAHETGIGTDISYFARVGDIIVFVFRRDRGTRSEEWKDSLLWIRADRGA